LARLVRSTLRVQTFVNTNRGSKKKDAEFMASLGTCEVEGRRTRNRVGELVEKQLGEGRLVNDRLLGRDALGRRSELG